MFVCLRGVEVGKWVGKCRGVTDGGVGVEGAMEVDGGGGGGAVPPQTHFFANRF